MTRRGWVGAPPKPPDTSASDGEKERFRTIVEAWLLECELCGRWFTQFRGPGRPRLFCPSCMPPGTFRRRPYVPVGPRVLVCVECGETFTAQASALVCSRRCKDARYRRLHPEAERARQARKDARRRARARRGEA